MNVDVNFIEIALGATAGLGTLTLFTEVEIFIVFLEVFAGGGLWMAILVRTLHIIVDFLFIPKGKISLASVQVRQWWRVQLRLYVHVIIIDIE